MKFDSLKTKQKQHWPNESDDSSCPSNSKQWLPCVRMIWPGAGVKTFLWLQQVKAIWFSSFMFWRTFLFKIFSSWLCTSMGRLEVEKIAINLKTTATVTCTCRNWNESSLLNGNSEYFPVTRSRFSSIANNVSSINRV